MSETSHCDDGVDTDELVERVAERIGAVPDLLLDSRRIEVEWEVRELARVAETDQIMLLQYRLARSPHLADLQALFYQESQAHKSRRRRSGLRQLGVGAAGGIGAWGYQEIILPAVDDVPFAMEWFPVIVAVMAAIAIIRGLIDLCLPKKLTGAGAWRRAVVRAAHIAATREAHCGEVDQRINNSSTARIAHVRQTFDDLLADWGCYKLDVEAWYLTKPLLRDTTGTVATTAEYEIAMRRLSDAVDRLHDASPRVEVDEAVVLADTAWAAWYEANEYAASVGLGDRTPTERAALQRLGKLVTRLTRSVATDPELPMIKRDIQSCLDKITTVAVGWEDIAALPAVERAGTLPQLTIAPWEA